MSDTDDGERHTIVETNDGKTWTVPASASLTPVEGEGRTSQLVVIASSTGKRLSAWAEDRAGSAGSLAGIAYDLHERIRTELAKADNAEEEDDDGTL